MTAAANYRIVVLFEDEVREAARAIAAVRDLPDGATPEVFNEAAHNALRMCMVALDAAEDDEAVLVLSRKPA